MFIGGDEALVTRDAMVHGLELNLADITTQVMGQLVDKRTCIFTRSVRLMPR